jgi:hypothetical protein
MSEGTVLSAGHDSLAYGVGPAVPGTLFALSVHGGVTLRPKDGREILIGRNRPAVHVCIGEDDLAISRVHAAVECAGGVWRLRTLGRSAVRLPGGVLLVAGDEPAPLGAGYTPVFVRGSADREHLVELFVAGDTGRRPAARHAEETRGPRPWALSADERLVLVVLARRYLANETNSVPLTWGQTAELLGEIRPAGGWTAKRVEHAVVAVRTRLSRAGVAGLTRAEVGEPVGNTLNINLIRELISSATLIPPDLELLDPS